MGDLGFESCFESCAGGAVEGGGMEGDKAGGACSSLWNAFRTSLRNDPESSVGGVGGFAIED